MEHIDIIAHCINAVGNTWDIQSQDNLMMADMVKIRTRKKVETLEYDNMSESRELQNMEKNGERGSSTLKKSQAIGQTLTLCPPSVHAQKVKEAHLRAGPARGILMPGVRDAARGRRDMSGPAFSPPPTPCIFGCSLLDPGADLGRGAGLNP